METKKSSVYVPTVFSTEDGRKTSSDIFSKLLENRIVMLTGEVEVDSMTVAASEIMFLNSVDNQKPIFLYIDSPGGSVSAGLGGLIDIMQFVSAPVYTVALGMAASMGAAILSAGEPGHRYALKSSQILVHPMSGGYNGRTVDNVAAINYEKRLNDYLDSTIAFNCKQLTLEQYEEIKRIVQSEKIDDRKENQVLKYSTSTRNALNKFKNNNNFDHWMFPVEAQRFGIIDKILTSEKDFQE